MSRMSTCDLRLRDCWTEYIGMIPMVRPYCEIVFQYSSAKTHLIADMPLRQDLRKYLE